MATGLSEDRHKPDVTLNIAAEGPDQAAVQGRKEDRDSLGGKPDVSASSKSPHL